MCTLPGTVDATLNVDLAAVEAMHACAHAVSSELTQQVQLACCPWDSPQFHDGLERSMHCVSACIRTPFILGFRLLAADGVARRLPQV